MPLNRHTMVSDLLTFSRGNDKLPDALIFSLRSGHDCPYAHICHTRVYPDRPSGEKIRHIAVEQGVPGAVGCYSAALELRFPKTFEAHKRNRDLLDKAANLSALQFWSTTMMVELIDDSLKHADPRNKYKKVRVHVSGDFFSYEYMWAWLRVAERHPNRIFYAYTKSLPFWLQHHHENHIPSNWFFTASAGGRADHLITEYPDVFKRVAHIVIDPNDPAQHKYPVEHGEDEMCFQESGHFDLIVHGGQPAGPLAVQARKNHADGWGYNKENLKSRRQKVKQAVAV